MKSQSSPHYRRRIVARSQSEFDDDWRGFDREHIWHPYAPLCGGIDPYPVVSASGVYLTLDNGARLIDAMASWWSVIHGYNHPTLNRAITDQLQKMAHVMFGGLTHQPAIRLAKKLIDITAPSLQTVFFCDSGSVSVEVAIKMAVQYWNTIGVPKKQKLLTIRKGYHGDTLGAMSVCDPADGMHSVFRNILVQHFFVDAPAAKTDEEFNKNEMDQMLSTLKSHNGSIAAVILEPCVQGAGGMRIYCPEYLRRARALCDEYDVLLILDEIATGFGRTGRLFAYELAGIEPDILCVGKAMTGGYMSMAATLTTKKIRDGLSANGEKPFMHGPTFMANPLACAVSSASIDLLLESDWRARIKNIEQQLREDLTPLLRYSNVTDVRVIGAIGVVELSSPVDIKKAQELFVSRGVWIRPFRNLVYLMPPYIIEPAEISALTAAVGVYVKQEFGC